MPSPPSPPPPPDPASPARRRALPRGPAREEADLSRFVLSVVAHDVGALTSAITMRAQAMEGGVADDDLAALGDIAGELRQLGATLRLMRGTTTAEQLAPAPATTLDRWWRVAQRLVTSATPRHVRLHTSVGAGDVSPTQSHLLTCVVLALLHDLALRRPAAPCELHLAITTPPLAAELKAIPSDNTAFRTQARPGRWWRYAAALATRSGGELTRVIHDGSSIDTVRFVTP